MALGIESLTFLNTILKYASILALISLTNKLLLVFFDEEFGLFWTPLGWFGGYPGCCYYYGG